MTTPRSQSEARKKLEEIEIVFADLLGSFYFDQKERLKGCGPPALGNYVDRVKWTVDDLFNRLANYCDLVCENDRISDEP